MMNKKRLLKLRVMKKILVIFLLITGTCFGQQKEFNPFESIGKPGKIITLSKGKYLEVHINDTLQRIGSVVVNMNTGTIYDILDTDTLYNESNLDPTIITRWYSPDPIVKHHESPYASMANNPIWFGDPDGRDTLIMHLTQVKSPDERYLVWKVTFTFIQDKIEYNMTPPTENYFGMDKETFFKEGNTVAADKLFPIVFESGNDMKRTYSKEWNQNNMWLVENGGGQFFHPASSLAQTTGCFIACEYPVKYKNNGYTDVATGPDAAKTGSDVESKQVLSNIREVHNEATKLNNDPTLGYFVRIGTPSSSSMRYGQREELPAVDRLPMKSLLEGYTTPEIVH